MTEIKELAAETSPSHGEAAASADGSEAQPAAAVGFDPIPDKAFAISGEIAQVADRWRWDEARTDEAMREQVRDPRAVLYIGLPARHRLDVPGIGQDHLEASFEKIEYRFPIHARGLHRHVRACRLRQPLGKPEQLGGRRAESLHLGLHPPATCNRRHATTDSL